jgi:hypothetical protein
VAEATPRVLTAEEAAGLRDAATADELEAAARKVHARWVAEALDDTADRIAERCGHKDYRGRNRDGTFEERWQEPKVWPADLCPFCSKDTELVRALAAEYREGTR